MTPAVRFLVHSFFSVFVPPERISCSEWALKYRRLSVEASSKGGGKFNFHLAPWQREVLDAPDDPTVRKVVLMWASQVTGKTETILNMIGYTIACDPCPMLVVQPNVTPMAETFSKDRFDTMVRDTPKLRGRVKSSVSRDSGNTIYHKRFRGGHITMTGANSAAGLASRPIRKLFLEETDRYPASAGTEGDPISLAEKRTESFPDAVTIEDSSPGILGISRITKDFDESDQRHWFINCPQCGKSAPLEWRKDDILWGGAHHFVRFSWTLPDGTQDRDLARACVVCADEACGHKWTEDERQAAVRAGRWQPTAPFNGTRGYRIPAFYTLFEPQRGFKTRLHQIADDFLKKKKKGRESLMVWTNTVEARPFVEQAEKPPDWEILFNRREPYTVPEKCVLLTCAVDTQANRLVGEVKGWGLGQESWGILSFTLFGNPQQPEVWQALDELRARTWEHPSGNKLRISITGVDSGGVRDKKSFSVPVYKYVLARQQASRGRGGVVAIKGSSVRGVQLTVQRLQKNGVNLLLVGTDTGKFTFYERLRIEEPGPRYCHFPDHYVEEDFRQMTAEELRISKAKGFLQKDWFKLRERNEMLDLNCYGIALFDLLNADMVGIAARFNVKKREYQLTEAQPASAPTATVQNPQPPPPMRRKRLPFRR